MTEFQASQFLWLRHGEEAFAAMLRAIEQAQDSVWLETYICSDGPLAQDFRAALLRARERRVAVRILIDAFGSLELSSDFWKPVVEAGGEFRWFNPLALNRFACRNHRKLLVCDGEVAFVGGYNLSDDYNGDGVLRGWRDLGLELRGPIVRELADSFDLMFEKAEFRQDLWQPLGRRGPDRVADGQEWKLLLNIPSFRRRAIKRTLVEDLAGAESVQIIAAYFLPTWQIRNRLIQLARRGGRVRLILAGKSDVRLAQLASQRVYDVFLRAGVEIYEYQPQILHAKLVIIDDIVYSGSCNLDLRSLNFNYELMVRVQEGGLAQQAREMFEHDLKHCRRIRRETWGAERSWFIKLKERIAHFLLARLDPLVARWQMRSLH